MNHKEAGIKKKVSEAVYPADILSDSQLERCSLLTRGAWYECLLRMWRDNSTEISGTIQEFARIWKCDKSEVEIIIAELKKHNPCNVTKSNNEITLTSRRLQRRMKHKKDNAKRQATHREKASNNEPVTSKKTVPSSSLSSSSTSIKEKTTPQPDWNWVAVRWNTLASKHKLRQINKVTDKRKKKYNLRIAEFAFDENKYWDIVEKELSLLGEFALTSNWFGFDFLINSEDNFTKFSEGNYRKEGSASNPSRDPSVKIRLEWERVSSDIQRDFDATMPDFHNEFISSLWDKYKDVPDHNGKKFVKTVQAKLRTGLPL